MQNNFSKCREWVPRGTRTIWRYLGALFILFTLAIGNVMAALPLAALPEGTNLLTNASGALTTWTTVTKNQVIYDDNNYFMAWSNGNALAVDGTGTKLGNSSKKSAIVFYVANPSDISVGIARNGSDMTASLHYMGTSMSVLTDPNSDSDGGGTKCDELAISASASSGTLTKTSGAAGYYKVFGTLRFYATSITITETSGGDDPEPEDTTAPTLASSVPANSATDVAVSGNIVLTMSENVSIADASKFSISGGAGSLTTASITASGTTVTIPYTGLANSTAYTLTVAANAIQDGAATPNKNEAFSISFTTAAPVVEPDYLLINQSNGDVNTAHFRTTSTTSTKSGGYSVGGTSFEKYIQLGGAYTTPVGYYETNKVVAYDAETNDVTVEAWIYNKASSDYKFYISIIEEGAEAPTIHEYTATKNTGTKFTKTFTPSTNATIYFSVGNNSNVFICQVGVYENGTALKKGGEIGYTVNLTTTRFADNKSATALKLDGIEYLATSNSIKVYTSGNPVKLKAVTEYIKFTLTETEKLSIAASGTYSVTKSAAYDSEKAISNNQDVVLTEGTWYIVPNGSNVIFASLTFATPPTMRTITLQYADGTTPDGSIQVIDGTAATKPADPTWAHHRFDGWYNGEDPYVWTANVTGNLTLTAHWTQLYTVTYAAGDGTATGDAPTQEDLATGEKFNVAANTFAVDGKDFVIWNDGTNDYAPNAEYTIGTANVVLTAQWKAASAKYTVHYMDEDGTTPLGDDELVEVGEHPAGISVTKPLYTFASWQLSGSDIALSAVSAAANEEVTLTARWAKAYASSYDMEAYAASDGASKAGIEDALTAANYAYTNINGIDNGHTHNYTYDGLKYKTNDGDLSFNVVAGKVVEVKTGHLPTNDAVTMYINGVADATVFEGADEAQETHKINYFYSAAEALYRLDVKASKGTCSVKKITIRDPYTVSYDPHGADAIDAQNATPSVTLPTPVNGTGNFKGWYDAETEGNKIGNAGASYTPTANITLHAQWEVVSSDNTLSDLQVDGATVAGFDPAVQIYNLVYEYGQQPAITSATATAGALATVTINNTPVEEATFKYVQVKVEAESGAERFYQVRYTNNPKQGATIFKAELTSNTAAEYSGMYADGDNSEIKLADDGANGYKFSGKSNYIKMAITDATFAEGDMLKMTYTTNPQQGELAIYDGTTKLQGTAYSNHILTFSDAADGKSSLFIRRTDDNNFNGWVSEVEVQRYMAPMIKSLKIGAVSGTIDQEHKTIAIELPFGTSLYGVAATIEAYANGGATVIAPTPLAYDTPLGFKVSSAYAEDGDVDYTLTITEADHYEAMIVGGANYETLAAAVAAAQADDVVKLLDNVDLMATGLTIAENITLDLNGFNIKAGEQIDNDIVVPAGKKLTLVDNSTDADGKIYTEQAYTGAVTGYGLVRVAGELLMQSGNIYAVIDSDPANLGQFAVVLGAGGKATIEGGQIKAGWYAISNNGNNTGSTIIVSGGELISTADFAIYNPAKESTVTVSGGVVYGAAGGIAMNRGELTVTGGTITSKDQGTTGTWGDGTGGMSNAAISASGKYESVEVEISGGTIIAEGSAVMITNGTTNPVEVAISGGQFSHVVPAEYCADGFAPVTEPNTQGKYEVEDKRIYIFDGSTMSNMATSPSGAISWAKVGDVMSATDKSGTYDEVNYTKALQLGNSTTTKHFKIDVALNNAAKIEVIGMSNSSSGTRHAWLTNSTDKGEIANAIASLATTGYNPEMFTTDWLEEGSYYLHADNTVNIFLIRVTEKAVDPKCEQPTITTQPATDLTFGAGNMTATVEAEVSDEGTLTYQWYNAANDEAVVGQTTATLTTADEGTYYVIVTNTKASHRDNSIKSDEAQLAHRVLNDATLSALGYGDPATAIALEADKYDYRVDLAMGTIDVPELTATATMAPYPVVSITNATEFVNYEAISTVEVTSEDGTAHKTYTVHFYVDHEILALVDVTGNMKWDFSKANDGTAATSSMCNEAILANVDGIVNNDDFESDNIMATANKFSSGKLQASMIKFHTTVPGAVIVKCANTGSNKPMRYLYVNGIQTELGSTNGTVQTYAEYVPAGDVVLTVMPTTETGTVMFNFTSVEFKVDNDLEPYRDDEWLAPGELGTICIPQGAVAVGADIYELVGKEPQYGKIVFETVEHMKPGKPYLFQAKGTRIDFILTDEAEASEPDNSGAMKGTFINLDLTELENVYYFAGHALWSCVDLTSLSVHANRAYVKLDEVEALQSPNPAPGRRRITLGVNGQNTATGLENLVGGEQAQKLLIDGQMYILRGEKLYDATGRLVK